MEAVAAASTAGDSSSATVPRVTPTALKQKKKKNDATKLDTAAGIGTITLDSSDAATGTVPSASVTSSLPVAGQRRNFDPAEQAILKQVFAKGITHHMIHAAEHERLATQFSQRRLCIPHQIRAWFLKFKGRMTDPPESKVQEGPTIITDSPTITATPSIDSSVDSKPTAEPSHCAPKRYFSSYELELLWEAREQGLKPNDSFAHTRQILANHFNSTSISDTSKDPISSTPTATNEVDSTRYACTSDHIFRWLQKQAKRLKGVSSSIRPPPTFDAAKILRDLGITIEPVSAAPEGHHPLHRRRFTAIETKRLQEEYASGTTHLRTDANRIQWKVLADEFSLNGELCSSESVRKWFDNLKSKGQQSKHPISTVEGPTIIASASSVGISSSTESEPSVVSLSAGVLPPQLDEREVAPLAAAAPKSSTGIKRKRSDSTTTLEQDESLEPETQKGYHQFPSSQLASFRSSLLSWYDGHRRQLPWRGDPSPSADVTAAAASSNHSAEKADEKLKKVYVKMLTEMLKKKDEDMNDIDSATNDQVKVESIPSSLSSTDSSVSNRRRPVSAYGVWVSEIMLQQTRVDTVIDYYNRWMSRFPTIGALAQASLDEVNSCWAGLGYYRRAKFLHQGARTIMEKHKGIMPSTVEGLLTIPGIGPYTAGAIGSIAFQIPTPLVDGNVIRVISRLRAIDIDPKNKLGEKLIWQLAGSMVDPNRPGDFNQALMELGATVCTPVNPLCDQCPVRDSCYAYREVQQKQRPCTLRVDETDVAASSSVPIIIDIEDLSSSTSPPAASSTAASSTAKSKSTPKSKPTTSLDLFAHPSTPCTICDRRSSPPTAVTAYPSKASKKAPLEQHVFVTIIKRSGMKTDGDDGSATEKYLIMKRPNEGLLAGQWELPSLILDKDSSNEERLGALHRYLAIQFEVDPDVVASALSSPQHLGSLVHIFSHRKHLMEVSLCTIDLNLLSVHLSHDRLLTIDSGSNLSIPNNNSKKRSRNDDPAPVTGTGGPKKKRTKKNDAANSDVEDELSSDDEVGGANFTTSAAFLPQSYRWVPLVTLQQDHASSSELSELGLTTGVRKVVKMISAIKKEVSTNGTMNVNFIPPTNGSKKPKTMKSRSPKQGMNESRSLDAITQSMMKHEETINSSPTTNNSSIPPKKRTSSSSITRDTSSTTYSPKDSSKQPPFTNQSSILSFFGANIK